jgi:type VI secretion system protein ImpG
VQQSDALYRGFLEEMHSLENFRMTYAGNNPNASLDREDPDVRRLIEAMAFFTARTRRVARENILATRRRLFRQYFSSLLSPLPAMGMLQAQTSGRFAEPVTLPAGAEVMLTTGEDDGAAFHTLWDLRVLPIRLRGVDTLLREGSGYRIALHFQAAYPRNDDIGTLSLHVSHMGTYPASLRVLSRIRQHLERAFVCFDDRITEESTGPTCPVGFGAPAGAEEPDEGQGHPLERIRQFFHFPERELYLNVDVPRPPRNWQRFSICFDVDGEWPRNLRLNEQVFQLFCVPVTNLRRAMSAPIACAGTKERYPIRHADLSLGYKLHSVVGVFELQGEGALVPLRPGVLGGGEGSFEVEFDGSAGGPDAWLGLDMPEAFESPKKIAVDARWLQPWFSELAAARMVTARLRTRAISGLGFELLGSLRRHVENRLQDDMDALLQVVSLKNRSQLSLEDLRFLLQTLGVFERSHFKGVPELFLDLSVSAVPRAREQGGGFKHVYRLRLKEYDVAQRPLVKVVLQRLVELLNHWIAEAIIEIEATEVDSSEVLAFA